ncbi:LuxR C-terminal-related transcriptional regulator [Baekduia alba]|uniref:LuxR C-terminal-related transcriptional regulator n=1 Tax=Baekduia alba TaxID=2997333 RepID=UPI002341A7BE|nr:LuxR C-terminal-related transcriptional regulator [Baekduia alba]
MVRARLHQRLDQAVDRPVTLVAAPPGAGKTMLLAAWLDAREHSGSAAAAWVSLDRDAVALPGLWARLVAALGPGTLRGAAPATPERVAERLLSAAEAKPGRAPLVVVLDDLQDADGPVLAAVLATLVRRPSRLRLVLSTRHDPDLPLHRLRVSGELAELRGADLAFTAPEAAQLLAGHDVHLAEEDLGQLVARTEGWAAGLRLAALSLAGHPDPGALVADFAGDDRAIVGFLIEEVLSRQPPDVRELLLRTSVVDRVSGPLADALTGATGGHDTLAALVRANAFVVPVDRHNRWFRYHGLFAELLRSQLACRGAEAVAEQHRRAAAWYAEAERPADAVRHAARGGDWDLAESVLAEHWIELRLDGAGATLDQVVGQLSADALERRPHVALVAAARSLDEGDGERAAALMRTAAGQRAGLSGRRRALLTRDLSLLRLERARRGGDAAAGLRERAVAAAITCDDAHRDRVARALAHLELGRLQAAAGDATAEGELRRAAELAQQAGAAPVEHAAGAERAWLCAQDGRLRQATLAADALLDRRGEGCEPALTPAHLARALAAAESGNTLLAASELDRAAHASIAGGALPDRLTALGLLLVRSRLLAADDHEGAVAVLAALDLLLDDWVPPAAARMHARAAHARLLTRTAAAAATLRSDVAAAEDDDELAQQAPLAVALARAELAAGDPAGALLRARAVVDRADVAGCDAVAALAVAAAAAEVQQERHAAAELTERALELAEPEGLRLGLADTTPGLDPVFAHLLRFGTSHRSLIGEVQELAASGSAGAATADVMPLRDELSERELAVLRYLPTMLTAGEIAAELFVTVNTVKSHLKSIYRKLDARGRRDAVRRARELGLVAPGRLTDPGDRG